MGRNQRDETVDLISSESNGISIDDAQFSANGSANVTISNVAPAAVGTATISKWLKFKDNGGTVYLIPCWT